MRRCCGGCSLISNRARWRRSEESDMKKTAIAASDLASKSIKTPIGDLRIVASEEGLGAVVFPIETRRSYGDARGSVAARMHLDQAIAALHEYFAGESKEFKELTLAPAGDLKSTRLNSCP